MHFKTVITQAIMYGAETWSLKKVQNIEFGVADMNIIKPKCMQYQAIHTNYSF